MNLAEMIKSKKFHAIIGKHAASVIFEEDAIRIAEAYAKEQKDELIKKIKEYKSNLEMITSTTPLEEGEIYACNHILLMESKDER